MGGTKTGWVSLDGFSPVLARWDSERRWNGWLCPSMDALSAVTVLDNINRENGDPVYMYDFTDEGFLMLVDLQEEDGGVELIEPDDDGLYGLGYAAWVWQEEQRVVGTFHTVATRDASALERDGHPITDAHPLDEQQPSEDGQLYEVKFTDGTWMLARSVDLSLTSAQGRQQGP